MSSRRFFPVALGAAVLTVFAPVFSAFADETQNTLRSLQKEVDELKNQMKEKDRQIEDLQKKLLLRRSERPPLLMPPCAI